MTILLSMYLVVLLLPKALMSTTNISPISLEGYGYRGLIRYIVSTLVRGKEVLLFVVHILKDVTKGIRSTSVNQIMSHCSKLVTKAIEIEYNHALIRDYDILMSK